MISISTDNLYMWLVIVFLILIKVYNIWITTPCTCKTRMDGKTVIVTGSNTGIGKETARDLARRGARVILACRNLEKAKEARDDIIQSTGNNKVEIRELDLSSLSSVRTFAKGIVESEPKLDVLINNAGLGGIKKTSTVDNFEMTFQVNHLGPFLLTCLLLDLLKKSAPSRIVIVSSWLHSAAVVDFDNLFGDKWYISVHQYCISKLANVLTTKELAAKLEGTGLPCSCFMSKLFQIYVYKISRILLLCCLSRSRIRGTIFEDVVEGSQTSIHVAVSKKLEGVSGKYFRECKESSPSKSALDKELAKRMWERSEILVGLKPEEKHY
ncbi:hypothetical protein L9F63_020374 [Diploptera punctata]|uniref:Retinol dehydrogenase 11 n=1 Tax=Diploptera punctata TaxID=6984 RepID=A0AAD7ZTW2_DIPPU|nr:hypothetical protein L9F63_020374 [Diploptera punctata]